MNKIPSSDPTIDYYDKNVDMFSDGTKELDLAHLYAEFLSLVPESGKILDVGCGSGRDAKFFKQQGYAVTAFDASSELVAKASMLLGERVSVMTFLDLNSSEEFDGVWACASLLHVPSHEMNAVVSRITCALKRGAAFYASFKYGSTERQKEGRYFNDYNEAKIITLLTSHPELVLVKLWRTQDVRPEREKESWLNVILKKRDGQNP